ncbi:exosortase-associated protein EpsI, B-type [Niveibacterium sp. SC-1]|uniref:exosortase-associated protein EpsI, B-type n=1 Tax=Niveibacterium sp. SC-1 TaxID=3135646 RepID=UPI00311D41BF
MIQAPTVMRSPRAGLVRALAILLLMVSASACAMLLKPTRRLADEGPVLRLEQVMPARVGDWSWDPALSTPTPPPQAGTLAAQIYSQVLERTYVNSRGYRLMVSVAYGPDQRESMQVHRPEFCYVAQGFAVTSLGSTRMDTEAGEVLVTRLDTQAPNRIEPVSYWTTIGTHRVTGGSQRRFEQLRYGLDGVIPDGLVFRVSSVDSRRDDAFAAQGDFIVALARQLPSDLRDRLMGTPSHG